MEKAKVTMRNWEPYVYDGEYNLSGTADVHPRLGRNVYVATTSTLVKASLEEDVLIYETRNTVYHCPLKYNDGIAVWECSTEIPGGTGPS